MCFYIYSPLRILLLSYGVLKTALRVRPLHDANPYGYKVRIEPMPNAKDIHYRLMTNHDHLHLCKMESGSLDVSLAVARLVPSSLQSINSC